jgi:hypothetical protein
MKLFLTAIPYQIMRGQKKIKRIPTKKKALDEY